MDYLRGGSILWVDLTKGNIWTEPTAKYERYVGGRAINAKILYDAIRPGVKAFDPENVLVFATGPLTGTFAPGSGRTEVAAKSPHNDLLGMSNMGGYWATELKYAGYDHLAITGRAEHPVYLAIRNDQVEIKDARHIWGQDTYTTPSIIRKELGDPDSQIVCIGKAGENLVRFASIISKVGNAAGKTGMGAVMGSKNLKAIAARGTGGVKVANPDEFFQECVAAHDIFKNTERFRDIVEKGTSGSAIEISGAGIRLVGNRESSLWEGDKPDVPGFVRDNVAKRTGCFSCPQRCMELYDVPGAGATVISCAVYADAIWKTKLSDLNIWYEAAVLCQRHGVDLATVFGVAAWAVDLYQRGIIDDRDTDGLRLDQLGTREMAVELLNRIVERQGIGDLLAEGAVIASEKLGRGSEQYVYHTRRIQHQSGNIENFPVQALAVAVGPRSDHLRNSGSFPTHADQMVLTNDPKAGEYIAKVEAMAGTRLAAQPFGYEGKGSYIAYLEKATAVSDILLHCKWHGPWAGMPVGPEVLARVFSAGTGRQWTAEMLMDAAVRLRTVERAFNFREGLTREDDTLPKQYFESSVPGAFPNRALDRAKFEKMKDEYYAAMGWDPATGYPTRDLCKRLGIEELADDLEKAGRLAVEQPVMVG